MDRKVGGKLKTVKYYYDILNDFAPFSTAEAWDNVGLLVGGMDQKVTGVLLALDVTSEVIKEAKKKNANLIITHHPIIFSSFKTLDSASLVYKLAQKSMSVLSAHTNVDMAKGGINDTLSSLLNLQNVMPFSTTKENPYYKLVVFVPARHHEAVYTAMVAAGAGTLGDYSHCSFHHKGIGRFLPNADAHPTVGEKDKLAQVEEIRLEILVPPTQLGRVTQAMMNAHPYEEPAYDIFTTHGAVETTALGRYGTLPVSFSPKELAQMLKETLQAPTVKYQDFGKKISTVAVCGGSGGSLLPQVLALGVDAFVTGEIKHDQLLTAQESGLCIFEAGHFASENIIMQPLYNLFSKAGGAENLQISESCTDGVKAV